MNKICLFGASGHGFVLNDIAKSMGLLVEYFIDDNPQDSFIDGIPVVNSKDIVRFIEKDFVISIGHNKIRKMISNRLAVKYTKLIHRSAIISSSVQINIGTVIMNGVNINANAVLGKHVIINTAAVVEHDCEIGDYAHISPNATITGNVKIGEGAHVGAGAILIPNVSIGKWATIGAGAVVVSDVPEYAVVVGNPARIIKYNKKE